jgi:hypothetical protein
LTSGIYACTAFCTSFKNYVQVLTIYANPCRFDSYNKILKKNLIPIQSFIASRIGFWTVKIVICTITSGSSYWFTTYSSRISIAISIVYYFYKKYEALINCWKASIIIACDHSQSFTIFSVFNFFCFLLLYLSAFDILYLSVLGIISRVWWKMTYKLSKNGIHSLQSLSI